MLFNSTTFLFGFLPLVLAGFFVLARWGRRPALAWLTAASLFFYAWWNPVWLPLLLASMIFNHAVGRELAAHARGAPRWRWPRSTTVLLVLAIGVDLALLVHYKYTGLIVDTWHMLAGRPAPAAELVLPLGISFFTFTQIAYLVDAARGEVVDTDGLRYGLFVTYYPHLIAGPILHHREMMPQFDFADVFRFDAGRLADGLAIFTLGLAKKVVLADQFARYATPAFEAARSAPLGFFESWGAALAYTLQLYFDFSGYSDMAIGLALMIGVRLPINFHSPYKAGDIADFWRRWHMTLSRFLRDYLYVPLGGNRRGTPRRLLNLMVTMLLGGLWHGAAWTFVVWGALHGALLVVHQGWRAVSGRFLGGARWPWGGLLTFLAVVVGWVVFRAADLATARRVLEGMAGLHGSTLPEQILALVPPLRWVADGAGKVPHLGDGTVMGAVEMAVMLVLGLSIVRFAPALHELTARTRLWLVVPCAALALQRVLAGAPSEFLYFQF